MRASLRFFIPRSLYLALYPFFARASSVFYFNETRVSPSATFSANFHAVIEADLLTFSSFLRTSYFPSARKRENKRGRGSCIHVGLGLEARQESARAKPCSKVPRVRHPTRSFVLTFISRNPLPLYAFLWLSLSLSLSLSSLIQSIVRLPRPGTCACVRSRSRSAAPTPSSNLRPRKIGNSAFLFPPLLSCCANCLSWTIAVLAACCFASAH